MGKLKTLRPSLGGLKPRLGYAPGDKQERNRQRARLEPWRKWYRTKRWALLRLEVFARDLYTCQQTGIVLPHKEPHPLSPVADHIVQHHGDAKLFWDPGNVQTVSKEYHDTVKRRIERLAAQGGGG